MNNDITTSTTPKCARFFRVQQGSTVLVVGSADGYINTAHMNSAQTQVAEQLNAELEQRLSFAAFGNVDATVIGECRVNPGQPTLVPMVAYSPVGANEVKQIVPTLVPRKLVGRTIARAVNTLRDEPYPYTLPREAAIAAAEHFGVDEG